MFKKFCWNFFTLTLSTIKSLTKYQNHFRITIEKETIFNKITCIFYIFWQPYNKFGIEVQQFRNIDLFVFHIREMMKGLLMTLFATIMTTEKSTESNHLHTHLNSRRRRRDGRKCWLKRTRSNTATPPSAGRNWGKT